METTTIDTGSAPTSFAELGAGEQVSQSSVGETPVIEQTEGTIEKSGGDGVTSFDELESLDAHSKMKKTKEAKDEAEKEDIKEEIKGDKKSPEKKAKDDKKETPKKEASPKTEESKDQKDAAGTDDEPQETEDGHKIIRINSGNRKVTIRDDAKFKVTGEDGTKVDVPLKELIDGHKRVLGFDQEKTQFSEEREVFLEQKRSVDDTIGEMASLLQEGQGQKALFKFFEVLGADPVY